MADDFQPVGKQLKELRERAGYSIRAACDVTGLKTPSAWKHYEDDVNRKSMPADMVIDLLQAWVGVGDPAISTADVLQLSPNLMTLFEDTGRNFNSTVFVERENIKLTVNVEARRLEDVQNFIAQWSEVIKIEK